MFNEMIVVSVTNFSGTTTPDKNGKSSVMLQCIAGKMPNRNVLSGTVAERAGFEVGKTYLVQCRERGYDQVFGTDFTFVKIQELTSGLDIIKATKELGAPEIITIGRPEGFENAYERKGDAVESLQTVRQKAGLYEPAIQGTGRTDHRTAKVVRDGSSVTGARDQQLNLTPEDLKNASPKEEKRGGSLREPLS